VDNIPAADIERRFARSLGNLLDTFSTQVDACLCFMNSDATPELVFEQQGELRNVVHAPHYQHLLKELEA
jgi:predicted ABC-type ATPase